MKLYAEKPTFLLFLSGALGAAISGVSKDWIFCHYSSAAVRLPLLFAPPVLSFALIYLFNITAISLTSPPELQERMLARWGDLSPPGSMPNLLGRADDMVDRTAAFLVWLKWGMLRFGEWKTDPSGISPSLLKSTLVKKNAEIQEDITNLKGHNLMPLLSGLKSVWIKSKASSRSTHDAEYFEDPIYGQISLDSRLLPIFYHPLFQRLNYVRQLSFAYLVFPSASHSRLSHILGVMRNAEVALRRIFQKGWIYNSKGRRRIDISTEQRETLCLKAQLCALLHDIGHGPFGHALDKLIPYIEVGSSTDLPDKVYSVKYSEDVLADEICRIGHQLGFDLTDVLNILDKERQTELRGYDGLILDLIDSPLDVDRMDYLVRDAHMTGLGMGHSNVQALIEHMCPFEREDGYVSLTFEESAVPHLENLVYARDVMYIHCYEHPRKVCAERLLVRLAERLLAIGFKKEDLMLLTDEQLLSSLSVLLRDANPEAEFLRSLQENCNFEAIRSYHLSVWSAQKNKIVFNEQLREDVKAWRDLRMTGKSQLKSVFINQPKDWEERICGEAHLDGSDHWKVVVTVPAYDAKQEQESQTRVLVRDGSRYVTKDLFDVSLVVRAVAMNLRPAREVIRIMVSEELAPAAATAVATACGSVFKK